MNKTVNGDLNAKTYDVAIIGGGVAGLLAALEAAKDGRSVVVLERSNRLGGRAITNVKNGVSLNLGGHALYRAGKAYTILQEHGVRLEGGKPASNILTMWDGQLFPMPSGPASLFTSKLLSWSGKLQLMRLMMKLTMLKPGAIPPISLREWAEREIADPMVRHLFYALSRLSTYAQDPDYQMAASVLGQIQRSLKGVLYLNGGWQMIVDQLQEKAVRSGISILPGKQVREIVQEEGRVRRLLLADGEELLIKHVISTIPPSDLGRLLPGAEGAGAVWKRWAQEARPSKAACLDLGLRRLPSAGRDFVIGLDQPIFFSHHTVHAQLTTNGSCVVHMVKYNGPGDSDPEADERALTAFLHRLHPGWEREVVVKQFLPSITVANDYPHMGRSKMDIGPEVPGIQGLYVAGDWASHGELLLDASAASARRAAEALRKES